MSRRPLAVLLTLGLVASALVIGTADAGTRRCRRYKPGELGAEAPLVKVTDRATKGRPKTVEVEVPAGVGIGGNEHTERFIGHGYYNVQVDTNKRATGLYVRVEMPFGRDYDLYLKNAAGEDQAHAAGFNPAPAVYNDNENGGHTEEEAEQLDGIKSRDCTGYTVDVASASAEGGTLKLKFWLGKAKYDPSKAEE